MSEYSKQDFSNQTETKEIKHATKIPDQCIVSAQISLQSQNIFIDHEELSDYLNWINNTKDNETIQKASLLTINNLSATNHENWVENLSKQNKILSLKECIDNKVCTCFHRAVFYSLLMQEKNISNIILEGRVIESKKEVLYEDPKMAPMLDGKTVLGLEEDAFEDWHLWNVILDNNKYYLVDNAFLIDNKPVQQEINFDNELRNTWTIKTPNNKFRHYLSQGTISIKP